MKRKFKITLLALIAIGIALLAVGLMLRADIPILNPKGWIGVKERRLLIISTLLMLIVVVPVYFLAWYIAWKYREDNTKAKYDPTVDNNILLEAIWWGVPGVIILVLSVYTLQGCRELDPFKPLDSEVKALTVQVVALEWKWLFIYPDQGIATVNYMRIPKDTPINFKITADAPMNSFWIPALGGQIYAMPGMSTKLHLIADEVGSYKGLSANLSGMGFAGMTFIAESTTLEDFDAWVQSVKAAPSGLTDQVYKQLVEPTINNPVALYSLQVQGLYDQIVMKYMER